VNYKNDEKIVNMVINLLLIFIGIAAIYPMWFVLIASVSSPGAIANGQVVFLPKGFNLDGYKNLLEDQSVWIGYKNSIIYTFVGTIVCLAVQIPAAYALSRKSLPGRKVINVMLVITMYFSGGMIPSFLLINTLGLYDSMWALVLPAAVSAFDMIIIRNYFENNIPNELYDAACIDGCGYFRFFFNIVLPLSAAIVAIVTMFSVQSHWNEYMNARLYIRSFDKRNLQQAVQAITATLDSTLSVLETQDYDLFLAKMNEKQLLKYSVVVVAMVPLIILYPFIQRYLINGVMVGAVKG